MAPARNWTEFLSVGFLTTAACLGHRELLMERPILVLPLLLLSWGLVRFCRPLGWQTNEEVKDPLDRLRDGKWRVLALSLLIVSLFFVDILLGDRTAISAPWFNLSHEALDESAGFENLVDAWAGFLIEGPSIYLTGSSFEVGEIPYWNPFEACGVPYAANGETAVFSAVQLPLHWKPSLLAWDLFAFGRMVLATWFAALLARAYGLSWRAAGFVGMSWALSGVFTLFANLVHLNCAMFLPLVGLALEAVLARATLRRAFLLATALGLALNGGNPQPIFAFSLLYAPRVLLSLGSQRQDALKKAALILGSGALALMVNALPLFSMAELLGRSANRTLFEVGRQKQASDLLAFASPPLPISAPSYGIVHAPQFWFIGSLSLALVLAGTLKSLISDGWSRRGLALGILLYAALMATDLNLAFARLPLIGGMNWTKYVSAAQLIGLILAARHLDRIHSEDKGSRVLLALSALLLLSMALAQGWNGSDHYGVRTLVFFLAPAALVLVWKPRLAQLSSFALLWALLELGLHLPQHPPRPAEPLERWPAELSTLKQNTEADVWVPMDYREAAFKDAAPPMLSGLLGWHDFRSVTALPSLDYHRFMSPWINCGPWPPYLLLGASREILLAPVIDHVGLKSILLRNDDFQAVVRSQRADLLEDSAVIRFGELQRSLHYGNLNSAGLLNLFPYEAACLITPDTTFKLTFDMAAEQARLAVRLRADQEFKARLRLAGQEFDLDNSNALARVVLNDITSKVEFELFVDSDEAVKLVFEEWWVKRHITKGRFDFDDHSSEAMLQGGHHLLVNRYPLPIARPVLRPRMLDNDVKFWDLFKDFAARGEGWKPREETCLLGPSEVRPELLESKPGLAADEFIRLERRGFNDMRLKLNLHEDRLVFVAVNYDPGWKAKQGARELQILKADGAFMAIAVEADSKDAVEFQYRPPSFERHRNLSLIGLGLYLILGILTAILALRPTSTRL